MEHVLGGGRGHAPASGPVYVRADRVEGEVDANTILEGSVEVRHDGVVLRGERAVYTFETDELQVRGKVHLAERGAAFEGPALDFKLEAHTGTMPNANYTYAAKRGRGESRLIEFLGDEDIRMHDATYTTCRPGDSSWWIRAETLDIDRIDQEAVGHWTTLYFEGVPIFASPYFDLPLGDQRRSGVLTPGFYQDSRLGQEFIVPIYWNIAPNRDYTFTPDLIPRRGAALDNEFRFLEPQYRGQLNYDVMPNDRTTGTTRDHIVILGQFAETFGPAAAPTSGLSAGLNYNRVSDDNYLIDFSHNIVNSSPEVLPQEAYLTYTQPFWNASLRVDKSQTLISLLATTDPGPYEKAPELTLNTARADWYGFDVASTFDATRFQHPAINPCFVSPTATQPTTSLCPTAIAPPPYVAAWFSQDGTRYIVNPSVSYPILRPGWFVTPKAQFNYTAYQLDPTFNSGNSSTERSLPLLSLDTGLIFDRPVTWLGESSRQTLEPRAYYAFVPYRNQNQLPNFDSAQADFNFAQLFTENSFTGGDRISQADQITLAVVSRVIEDASGAERLRLAFGQQFYFGSQLVTLPGVAPRTNPTSDALFLASANLGKKWSADMGLNYDTLTKSFALANFGLRWQPRLTSVINFSYRYESAELVGVPGVPINQLSASTQWPVTARWYGVGALNYSIADRAWVQTVGGMEYKADCWVGRFVLSRYATPLPNSVTLSSSYTTAWFLQIELNGLTSVGTSPLDQLQRSITGFQRINPLSGPAGPFDNYE